MEKVNGQWQAAAFRFTQGLTCGVNRLAWGPDGALYIGGIGANGNWSWEGHRFGLERLEPTGDTAFEMHRVSVTPDGFEVYFTRAIDPAWLANPANFHLSQWYYEPTKKYGGPKKEIENLTVTRAVPHADGKGVRLVVDGLKRNRVVYLRTDPISTDGESIWSTECFYTLNEIPRAEALTAQFDGTDLKLDGGHTAIGPDAALPPGGVQLVGRSYRGHLFPTAGDNPKMPRSGVLMQDDLLQPPAGDDGVELDPARGPLRTAGYFRGVRLHLEWFGSPGGPGLLLPGGLRVPALPKRPRRRDRAGLARRRRLVPAVAGRSPRPPHPDPRRRSHPPRHRAGPAPRGRSRTAGAGSPGCGRHHAAAAAQRLGHAAGPRRRAPRRHRGPLAQPARVAPRRLDPLRR